MREMSVSMLHGHTHRFSRAVAQCAAGSLALGLLTFVCFRLGLHLATTAFLYLIVIVLLSLQGSFLLSAVFSLVAGAFLAYYFAPPIFSFRVSDPLEAVAIFTFLTTSAVITHMVSKVQKSEEALRRQANLLEQTHDAIFVWEFPRTIVFWNRGAEHLYGFSKEEAIGRPSHELLQTDHPLPTPVFEAALEREGEWTGELTHTARDGRKILVESRHVLMREADGRRLVLETNSDITERRHAEEAMRKAQAELAHVARVTTLGEMAASIAHEVDQPLSGVVINANACLRFLTGASPNLDEVRDGLQAIARDGRRASDVIGRIRALARRTSTEKEPLDINEVIREVVALAEGEARRARARCRTELAGDLPRVVGDRVQLQQVVLNLLLNGLEAMHAVVGRPRDLVISSQREATDRVRVAVQDSGSGIDPQFAPRMFEAFYTTKPGGLGMGLSISRSIVEQHGGRLWAVPNDGHGTTFQFTV